MSIQLDERQRLCRNKIGDTMFTADMDMQEALETKHCLEAELGRLRKSGTRAQVAQCKDDLEDVTLRIADLNGARCELHGDEPALLCSTCLAQSDD